MSLNNLSIARRLALVLGLMLALSLVSSLFAVFTLRRLSAEVTTMVTDNIKVERAAADWLRYSTAGIQRASAIARSSDTGLVEYFAAATAESVQQTNVLQKFIQQHMDTPEELALFAKIGELRKTYLAAREDSARLKQAGDATGAREVFEKRFEPISKAYTASLQALSDQQRAQLDAAEKRTEVEQADATALLLGSAALSLAIGALLAWLLARSITTPLRRAEQMAGAIARMDLTQRPDSVYANDETGRLLKSMDMMRTALTSSLQEVRSVVDGISTASAQIATGNHDLSARTEQTAANLEQTASSMEELTATVRQSADSATHANELASSAAAVAQRGGSMVADVVATMEQINESARRIADITGVIDGIAFQTNILALNAAVEAARAGEHGRGFAVVATEVRNLAQRSAESAREIKVLIGASVDKVETGARLVEQAGATMQEIVASVQRVSDIIGEITVAAAEQSDGIGQVNTAVTQLDQMTQQNAALVEESDAAAASLKEQAVRLSSVVAVFRLDDSGAAARFV